MIHFNNRKYKKMTGVSNVLSRLREWVKITCRGGEEYQNVTVSSVTYSLEWYLSNPSTVFHPLCIDRVLEREILAQAGCEPEEFIGKVTLYGFLAQNCMAFIRVESIPDLGYSSSHFLVVPLSREALIDRSWSGHVVETPVLHEEVKFYLQAQSNENNYEQFRKTFLQAGKIT